MYSHIMRTKWNKNSMRVIFFAICWCWCCRFAAHGFAIVLRFAIAKNRIPGIWKLFVDDDDTKVAALSPPRLREPRDSIANGTIRPPLLPALVGTNEQQQQQQQQADKEILLKLNPDGSFRQCSEGYQEGCWISGRWSLIYENNNDASKLLLALDRQYYGPRHDTLLEGTLMMDQDDDDNNNRTVVRVHGRVFTGKFMYPKQHPSFFDEPLLVACNATGDFIMEQAVATFSVMPSLERPDGSDPAGAGTPPPQPPRYQASNFYGRTFYLTVEPMSTHRAASSSRQQRPKTKDEELREGQPVDIRAMPIQFFANNTFQAFGTNKILRGRFGIVPPTAATTTTTNENEQLWLQVSLFGAGRSAPGSVYSEGLGLGQDDKRLYVGEIVEMHQQPGDPHCVDAGDDPPAAATTRRLFVRGSVTIGSDLGTDARPEPVGCFQLFETSDTELMLDDDDDDDKQDGRCSIFE